MNTKQRTGGAGGEPTARWSSQQMVFDRGDGGSGKRGPSRGDVAVLDWNKGEMAITHGEPQHRIDPASMGDSEAGPSGRRANPGGGERWAHGERER